MERILRCKKVGGVLKSGLDGVVNLEENRFLKFVYFLINEKCGLWLYFFIFITGYMVLIFSIKCC